MDENTDCPAAAQAGAPELILSRGSPGAFALLLQAGVYVPASEGTSVHDFLLDFLEVNGNYLDERVRTVFINGLATDALTGAFLTPGMRLALSGALPGLAGAVLRRGGFYAKMRDGVTFRPREAKEAIGSFLITVRFFNVVGADLAGRVLSKGILVDAGVLERFLRGRPTGWLDGARLAGPDGLMAQGREPVLRALAGYDGLVRLTVRGIQDGRIKP